MKIVSWCLLITSAFLYAIPFILSIYAWWIVFIFPIPLFYVVLHEKLGFKEGAVFGVIMIGTDLAGVFLGIDHFTMAQDGLSRLVPALGLLSYAALAAGSWFAITSYIKQKLTRESSLPILILWTISLWCFIFFLDRLCLWPFGRMEGYFGFHPLVPLALHPRLLQLLPYIGKNILSFFLYLVPASITLCIVEPSKRNILLLSVLCIPWILSIMLPRKEMQRPTWLNNTIALPALFPRIDRLLYQAQIAQQHFKAIKEENSQHELILLPESSFQCEYLSTNPELCNLWSEKYVGKPMHVVLGTFRWDGTSYRNSLHWVYNGELLEIFDKRHAMPVLERVPLLLDFEVIHTLFFKNRSQIVPSEKERPRFKISDSVAVIPYICSELFFNEHPDDKYPDTPILSSSNDLWGITLYVADLMYLAAKLKAMQWERDIIYVSYKYATYFDRYGNEAPIAQMALQSTIQ